MEKFKTSASGPYSSHKAAHHSDKIIELREGKQITPSFIQIMIGPTTLSNYGLHIRFMNLYLGLQLQVFAWFEPCMNSVNTMRQVTERMMYERVVMHIGFKEWWNG